MRAKTVNEQQDFERGKDPKEAMGVGITGYEDYISRNLEAKGQDPSDFWEVYYNVSRNQKVSDIMEEYLEILKQTPLEFQKTWADAKLEWWEEMKDEGWI